MEILKGRNRDRTVCVCHFGSPPFGSPPFGSPIANYMAGLCLRVERNSSRIKKVISAPLGAWLCQQQIYHPKYLHCPWKHVSNSPSQFGIVLQTKLFPSPKSINGYWTNVCFTMKPIQRKALLGVKYSKNFAIKNELRSRRCS